MKIQYFRDTDTLLIDVRDLPVFETRELDPNTFIDVDKAGTVCSITIEHATGGSGVPTVASSHDVYPHHYPLFTI